MNCTTRVNFCGREDGKAVNLRSVWKSFKYIQGK